MSNKFYVVLICMLTCSVLLLGLSYKKQSSDGVDIGLIENNMDTYRAIYSNQEELNTLKNNQVRINLINKKDNATNYALVLEEIDNDTFENIFYSLDGENYYLLTDNMINLGTLNAYGNDGDTKQYDVSLKASENYTFKYTIKEYIFLNEVSYDS